MVSGKSVSAFSEAVLRALAQEARISHLIVTSVKRTVPDQARIFFEKHVLSGLPSNYKNPNVGAIIKKGKKLHDDGEDTPKVVSEISRLLVNLEGGPETASRHLLQSPFTEVFDIAHFSMRSGKRHNYLSNQQAIDFLVSCRKRYGFPISRLGISKELNPAGPFEMRDEQCFHFEMLQPAPDYLNNYQNVT